MTFRDTHARVLATDINSLVNNRSGAILGFCMTLFMAYGPLVFLWALGLLEWHWGLCLIAPLWPRPVIWALTYLSLYQAIKKEP